VKRSTLNVQWGDRKGPRWAEYGDRHEIWTTGLLTALDPTKGRAGRPKPAGRPDMGTDTMSGIRIRNVQRETFNSQLLTGWPKGRMVGGIWGQTRNLDDRTLDPVDLTKGRSGGPGQPWRPDMGTGTMSGIPIRNVERPTFNSQLSTG